MLYVRTRILRKIGARLYKIVMVSPEGKQHNDEFEREVMLTSWVEGGSDDVPRAEWRLHAALFLGRMAFWPSAPSCYTLQSKQMTGTQK